MIPDKALINKTIETLNRSSFVINHSFAIIVLLHVHFTQDKCNSTRLKLTTWRHPRTLRLEIS